MSAVNECRPDGKFLVVSQFSNLLGNFVHNLVSDFALPLDFDSYQRPFGADEKVYLASFIAFCRVLHVGGGRKDERLFKPDRVECVKSAIDLQS